VRVLVTGGAGYVGSQTTRLLQTAGHEPIVLDTLDNGHREAIPGVDLVVGSVADGPLVHRLLLDRRIEAVLHFAALKAAEESVREPGRYFSANVGGSFALLAAMEAAAVPWFVFSSTCGVYGEPRAVPIAEGAETRPENPYGESKLLVERALPWYEQRGIQSVSLRYFNAAGAQADGKHGEDWRHAPNLVPVAIKSSLGLGGPLRVFGTDYPTPDGTAIRDYVHVADLADAHIRALEHLAGGNGATTLNLGTGMGSSVRDVIAAVERATGQPIDVVEAPRRAGDPAAVWADPGKAHEILGWKARHGLTEIVDSAVRWHRGHPGGYAEAAAGPGERAAGRGEPAADG
jgi:UDP-glucose-4-epimerase GalE